MNNKISAMVLIPPVDKDTRIGSIFNEVFKIIFQTEQTMTNNKIRILGLSLSVIIGLSSLCSCSSAEGANTGYVYECKGPKAKVYHRDPYCKGLNNCSASVRKVKESKRRPCRICAKYK